MKYKGNDVCADFPMCSAYQTFTIQPEKCATFVDENFNIVLFITWLIRDCITYFTITLIIFISISYRLFCLDYLYCFCILLLFMYIQSKLYSRFRIKQIFWGYIFCYLDFFLIFLYLFWFYKILNNFYFFTFVFISKYKNSKFVWFLY